MPVAVEPTYYLDCLGMPWASCWSLMLCSFFLVLFVLLLHKLKAGVLSSLCLYNIMHVCGGVCIIIYACL